MASLRKLIALDEDDLAVISAHVQDASVHVADILWRQNEKRLVIGMKRLDWDQAVCSGKLSEQFGAASDAPRGCIPYPSG